MFCIKYFYFNLVPMQVQEPNLSKEDLSVCTYSEKQKDQYKIHVPWSVIFNP